MAQKPLSLELPQGNSPIPVPARFDQQVDAALDVLAATGISGLDSVRSKLDEKVDQALLISLDANTGRLTELTREQDYNGSYQSPLIQLARYEELWTAARSRYSYLQDLIDFEKGRVDTQAYLARIDQTKKRVRYVSYGVGAGLGIVAMAATFGVGPAMLGGISTGAWTVASGAVLSSQSVLDYIDSKGAAAVAKGMFYGSARTGSAEHTRGAIQIAENDYRFMIASLITLGLGAQELGIFSKAREVIMVSGRSVVTMSEGELQFLRGAVATLSKRATALAPLGRATLAMLNRMFEFVTGVDAAVPITQAIEQVAKAYRMAVPAVRARMASNPLVAKLMLQWGEKVKVNPQLVSMMVREQVVNFGVTVVSEALSRRDRFFDEFGYVMQDYLSGVAVSFFLVWQMPAPVKAAVRSETQLAMNASSFNGKQAMKAFAGNLKPNFIMGFASTAGATAITEGVQIVGGNRDNLGERAEMALSKAVYSGMFSAISSNLRYTIMLNAINGRINATMAAGLKREIVLTGISTANSLFGGWSYVELAKLVGVEKTNGETIPLGDDPSKDPNIDPTTVSSVQMEKLGGAYLRVNQTSDEASYLFDFLKDGDTSN